MFSFSFDFESRIRISTKVRHQKPTRCSLINVQQMDHHDDTDQERFLVVRQDFTVRYKNPK